MTNNEEINCQKNLKRTVNALVLAIVGLIIFCIALVFNISQLNVELENDQTQRAIENQANSNVMKVTREVLEGHQEMIERNANNIKGLVEVIKLRDELELLKKKQKL